MMTWGIDPPALAFALAQALLRASVAGGIAAALVWTVCRLRPALPPAVRAALWWLVCAKFLLGLWPQPVGLPVLPADASPRVAAAGAAATSGVPPGEAAADATAADAAHAGRGTGSTGATEVGLRTAELARLPLPFMPLMAALARAGDTMAHVSLTTVGAAATVLLWVGALVLITRRSARRWRALRALADEARPVPAGTRAQLDDVAAQLGVALPLLASSPRVASPLLMWWRRTRVLLPEAALTSWPIRHRDAAVAHELVHIRRGDLWWGLVPSLAERLFFFHPLARLAASEYAVARESACDVEVVTGLALPTPEYGRLLIQLGIRSGSGLAVAGAPSSLTALKRRLTMLSHLPSNRRPPRWVWALVGCAALATLPFTLVARAEGCEGWGQVCDSTFAQNAPGHSEPCAIADLTPPPPPPPPAAAPQTPPPAPPAPPAPPPPPPPPPPAPPAKSGDSWALVGDGPTYVAGDGEGLARAREHAKGGTPVLWFRRDGREYIVRDPELLGRVRSVLSERMSGIEGDELTRLARELSDEMKHVVAEAAKIDTESVAASRRLGELARARVEAAMAKAGERMKAAAEELAAAEKRLAARGGPDAVAAEAHRAAEDLARRQAEIAIAQQAAAVEAAHAVIDDETRKELETLARDLADRHAAVAREHAKVAGRQQIVSTRLADLARQHAARAKELEAGVRNLIDEALASGKAMPVK